MYLALLSGLALLAQTAPATASGMVILACDIPAAPSASATAAGPKTRTFQVGKGTLREWNQTTQEFGQNFCANYACSKAPDRSEGTLSSASVAYTIGIKRGSTAGYWRAAGASGFGATQGACRVIPAPPRRK